MKIEDILLKSETIEFTVCCNCCCADITVRVMAPNIVGSEPGYTGRVLAEVPAKCEGNHFSIPRFDGSYDRLTCAFAIYAGGETLPGVKYVTTIDPSVPECDYPYPQPDSIKALSGSLEDMKYLGVHQTFGSANIASWMTTRPKDDDIPFVRNGKTYYFRREVVEAQDKSTRAAWEAGILSTFYIYNSSFYYDLDDDPELLKVTEHPNFDHSFPEAYQHAFNLCTEDGVDYFCAFIEFIAARYSREDAKYGRVCGMVMSNEVNSMYIWCHAGEMTCDEFTLEYTSELRLAWLLAAKHYANFRVYISIDHYFCGSHVPSQPKRFYSGRAMLESLAANSERDGNFPWNVSWHPYPETLAYPDFYNDRSPNFTFSTPLITFKNIEMLPAYLSQERFLYKGAQRRVILSEQGFNSRNTELTELQGAHAYCLAYLKIRNQPTIDLFTHAWAVDNPHEFGLNLGLRRFGGYGENGEFLPGEPKPIYYVVRDMDTPAEKLRIADARTFIGPLLFDELLSPTILRGERDTSNDGLPAPEKKKK